MIGQVFSEVSKIKQHFNSVPDDEEWLVQKYIERPFLLWGRKFDFRIWILVRNHAYTSRGGGCTQAECVRALKGLAHTVAAVAENCTLYMPCLLLPFCVQNH